VLTLATADIAYGESPTIAYTKPATNGARDVYNNALATFTAQAVTNAVPPAISTATVPAAGTTLVLVYAGDLDEDSIPDPGDFAITTDGTPTAVAEDGVAILGDTVTLTLTVVVASGDSLTFDYTAGDDPILSAEGFQVADLDDQAITNNSTQ
jgi:uncharacterized repeat protein (TIGR02059 family)